MRFLLWSYFLLSAFPLFAGSPTFYVAVNGSDTTGDGSLANPWATIQHAVRQVPDESLVLVQPGTYQGRNRLDETFAVGVTVRSAQPYAARLRNNGPVITIYTGQGITLEGFDIAHDGPGASALVIQIQDLIGGPGGADATERIVIRNNILHDSYNNDVLKINFGCRNILVEGNLFFNQSGSDEHIDINGVVDVTVQDNIFLNDFAGSGRSNPNNTSSFIVIKNSGGVMLNEGFIVRRNIFLNWEGSSGSNFLLLGEDGQPFFEARDVLVENNLMLGNSGNQIRAAFGVKGCREILFRHNTVSGDLPANAFAMRMNQEGQNPVNDQITYHQNIWSDPTGTMGASAGGGSNDFSDTPLTSSQNVELLGNLYWNGGQPLPSNANDLVNPDDDGEALTGDPQLADPAGLMLPGWDSQSSTFASGAQTIREEFERLVEAYGKPLASGAGVDQADPTRAADDDILGRKRGPEPDMGAYELEPCLLMADFDLDGDVDLVDLALQWVSWLGSDTTALDLDNDGVLTVKDMVLATNERGQSCL